MEVTRSLCVRDFTVMDSDGDRFSISRGEWYCISKPGEAIKAYEPEAKENQIIVFGKYWALMPADCFSTADTDTKY